MRSAESKKYKNPIEKLNTLGNISEKSDSSSIKNNDNLSSLKHDFKNDSSDQNFWLFTHKHYKL